MYVHEGEGRDKDFVDGESKLLGSCVWTQVVILLQKNAILARRNWKATVGLLTTPIAVMVVLICFQALSNSVLSMDSPNPPVTNIGIVPHCTVSEQSSSSCKTLVYAPTSVPWVAGVCSLQHFCRLLTALL